MNPRCLSKTWQLFTVNRVAGGCKKRKKKERKRKHVCFEQTETSGVCLRADMTGRDWKFSVCTIISHRLENEYMHVDELYEYDDSDSDLTLSRVLSRL